jgi:TolA-binding protein
VRRSETLLLAVVAGILLPGCPSANLDSMCGQDHSVCMAEAQETTADLDAPRVAAHARAALAARDFGRACKAGDLNGCEQALGYWLSRSRAKQDPRTGDGRDTLTQLDVAVSSDESIVDPQERIAALWSDYEQASFDLAHRQNTEQAYAAYLQRFPHGAHSDAAQSAIVAVRFTPIADAARASNDVGPVLDYAELHPDQKAPRDTLMQMGLEGRKRQELGRIAKLALRGNPGPDFTAFAARAKDMEEDLALKEAAAQAGDAGVSAVQGWIQAYPTSARMAQAKTMLADKAFDAALAKTGDDRVSALHAYVQQYPGSAHAAEAHQREVGYAAEAALAATTAAPMWRFLDTYPSEPQAADVEHALGRLLLSKDAHEDSAQYDRFVQQFPDAVESKAIAARAREVKRREAEQQRVQQVHQACAASCVRVANARCAAESAAAASGTDLSPKAMCLSKTLRPCCTQCGMSIDTTSYAACR